MTSVVHMITGAYVATQLPQPLLYIPIILVLHYLQDWTPHWDAGTGLSNKTKSKQKALLMGMVDFSLAVTIVYLLWRQDPLAIQIQAWTGAVVAMIPDIIEAPKNFLKINPWPLKPLNDFHDKVHQSTPIVWLGLLPQIIIVALIFFLK